VVFRMIAKGAVDEVLPLDEIVPGMLRSACNLC